MSKYCVFMMVTWPPTRGFVPYSIELEAENADDAAAKAEAHVRERATAFFVESVESR